MNVTIFVTSIVMLFAAWVGILKHQIVTLHQERLERQREVLSSTSAGHAKPTPMRPAFAHGHNRENGVLTWTIDVD